MSSASGGLTLPQFGKNSLMRQQRDYYFAPIAAATGWGVASVDPSTMTVGTALTLVAGQTAAGILLRRARKFKVTLTDASGGSGGLAMTFLIVGFRWGQRIQEYVSVTCVNGSATSTTTVNLYQELSSVTPVLGVTTAASGDAMTLDLDGTTFGLDFPIDNVADVIQIWNVSTNTEQVGGSVTTVSSSTVDATPGPAGSFIKGITLAVTDRWEVLYLSSMKQDGFAQGGVFA